MGSAWEEFVRRAVQGEEDEPFVRLLRERVRTGYRIVRVELARPAEGATPEYTFILERLKFLSDVRVPHSASLTRWMLEDGIKLASVDQEALRFGLLTRERFAPVMERLGKDYFRSLFVERVKRLAPPRTSGRVKEWQVSPQPETGHKLEAARQIEEVLASLARDLVAHLGFSEQEAAGILDQGLDSFAAEVLTP